MSSDEKAYKNALTDPACLEPRLLFTAVCPRCGFNYPSQRGCPQCSDTSEFDTNWKVCYMETELADEEGETLERETLDIENMYVPEAE